jgi:chromosome segregation ATPase
MTDTINHNGAHDAHSFDAPTADTDGTDNELEEVAQMWERRRAKWDARKREANKEMEALRDRMAVITAELGRCNREITAARSEVKVRGRKKAPPAKSNGRK